MSNPRATTALCLFLVLFLFLLYDSTTANSLARAFLLYLVPVNISAHIALGLWPVLCYWAWSRAYGPWLVVWSWAWTLVVVLGLAVRLRSAWLCACALPSFLRLGLAVRLRSVWLCACALPSFLRLALCVLRSLSRSSMAPPRLYAIWSIPSVDRKR